MLFRNMKYFQIQDWPISHIKDTKFPNQIYKSKQIMKEIKKHNYLKLKL